MTLLATFLMAWLTMIAAPDTPVARLLRRCLVEQLAVRVMQVTRGHLALALLLGGVAAGVAWIGEADGLRMATMAAPEVATWLTTFEVATYLDVAIGAATAWVGLRAGGLPLHVLPARRRTASRRRRAARRVGSTRAADSGDRPARRAALAA